MRVLASCTSPTLQYAFSSPPDVCVLERVFACENGTCRICAGPGAPEHCVFVFLRSDCIESSKGEDKGLDLVEKCAVLLEKCVSSVLYEQNFASLRTIY